MFFFFFFQAEDGIRDVAVTGVQTCALPICGWDIEGEPYSTAPGSRFRWWRARMVGGRTNHWGRISLRFGPYDFKRKTRDGLGDDWPMGYEDVAPFYDRVDRLIGVFGSKENLPNDPDGGFLPPPRPR